MNMNVTAALFYSAMQHLNKIQRKKESDSNYRSLKRTPLRCHVMVYVMITTNYSIAYYLKSFFCNIAYSYSLQGSTSAKFRFYVEMISSYDTERIIKIGQHLPKLQ